MFKKLTILALVFSLPSVSLADAPGAPGIPHRWPPALKQAVGTAYEAGSANSPVWFTVAEGILTEVFYPNVDQAQIGDLQFLLSDGNGYFSEQKRDTTSTVSWLDQGATVQIVGTEKKGRYSFEQNILADPAAPVIRIRTTLRQLQPASSPMKLFILFKPTINNTGAQNIGFTSQDGLYATKLSANHKFFDGRYGSVDAKRWGNREFKPVHAALISSSPWVASSAGYVGFSDGWQDISRHFRITEPSREAGPGNIALTGEIEMGGKSEFTYELALGFGGTSNEAQLAARASLATPFENIKNDYDAGWKAYLSSLATSFMGRTARFMQESPFARRSAITIKMHEDKRSRGAITAALSKPAMLDGDQAMDGSGGYHVIWPRDLYHASMGLLAAGDIQTPKDVLSYCVKTQRSDGSWPQNFWVDGTPFWHSLQMDEIAFPILLAGHLVDKKVKTLSQPELDMVRRAAEFITSYGPATPQDRWEELGGFSPSTIATQIAALKIAASLTKNRSFAATAELWQANIERWTMVSHATLGSNYYLRISPSGNPDDPEPIELANGGGKVLAADIIDGGFLDLVRFRVRGANDPRILNTLQIYEKPQLAIAVADALSPGAMAYRRYNHDLYGANRVGGFWPLLAGERGHFAVSSGNMDRARIQLLSVENSALPTGMLPEQTITPPSPTNPAADMKVTVGRGVACPLVWAHAEDILLHKSIEEGTVFDAPPVAGP